MNLSHSVDLIWRLAAAEMRAGEFKEVEPEHFCMALLKFAELPVGAVDPENEHAEIAKSIAAEAELVREALQKCGIESTRARRKLRTQLGKGGTPHQDGQVHRSAGSRALFESAAHLAQEFGRDVVTPLHLLTALVQSPTPAIAQLVLGNSTPPPPPVALLLLDRHGKDLVKEGLRADRLKSGSALEAQSKAVLQILLQKDRRSVLLVSDNNDLTESIATAVALAIATKEPPLGLKRRRLIDISGLPLKGLQIPPEREAEELERLRPMLAEAASHPEIILLVPEIEAEDKSVWGGLWTRLLRETLAKGAVQFICRVAPAVFKEHLCKDPMWKRKAEAIWLESAAFGSVPREL